MEASDESTETASNENQPGRPTVLVKFVYSIFFWCMTGVAVIYGIRIYQDVPIHPSFIPIIGAVFAAILAFTLIMAFRIVAGPIRIKSGTFELDGASGPTVLWCICFLSIAYGLYLLGLVDVAKTPVDPSYKSCSVSDTARKLCILQEGKDRK